MVLYEFEGKTLFKKHGIPILPSLLFHRPEPNSNREEYYGELKEKILSFISDNEKAGYGKKIVIKAQITAGHRGKRGLVKVLDNIQDAMNYIRNLFSRTDLAEGIIRHILVEPAISIKRELYLSALIDRESKKILALFCPLGGIDIEEISKKYPDALGKRYFSSSEPIFPYKFYPMITRACNNAQVELSDKELVEIAGVLSKIVDLLRNEDLLLVEINPMAIGDHGLVALDSKVAHDMNARFRHPEWEEFTSLVENLSEHERKAKESGIAYVQLSGDIGTISCGAGLSMATCDLLVDFGGSPANFLDVGGGATPEKVFAAMEILLSQDNLKGILINVFGGITRCDEVAQGIINAMETFKPKIPIVVRLIGTNDKEGVKLLAEKGIEAFTDMEQSIKKIIELTRRRE